MTAPQPPEQTPAEQAQADATAAAALALILVAAAALAAATVAAGAAGVAGTAAQTVGAVVTRRGRTPRLVAPAGPPPREEALRVLRGLGADERAAAAILAAFFDHPLPQAPSPSGAGVGAAQAREAALWRARYLVTATRRLADALERARAAAEAAGDPVGPATEKAAADALRRERRYWRQHLDAERDRVAGGEALDEAVAVHGPWLTWRSRRDDRVTRECAVADGHLFRVDDPPWIGLPGTGPHRQCRCYPLGPTASTSGLTVDEALARAGITRHQH